MLVKRLEITGFKSFAEKTTLDFGKGMTVIVGPNGCGKSNVSDAIRWVLGEQASKLLRGHKMEDFIFNGSSERKPAGFTKVSLTFEVPEGTITTPFGAFREITVTRALYRSGESAYFINKTACRLKDITDLFLDTGINTRSLSIIAQGQIEALINARPEERRILIEEAAGVVKYKSRRSEAVRKLESTHKNLERLQDLIEEREKTTNHLNKQARKAERAKKTEEDIIRLWEEELSIRYQEAIEKHTKEKELKTLLHQKRDRQESELALLSASISESRLNLDRQEEEYKTFSALFSDVESKRATASADLRLVQEKTKLQENLKEEALKRTEELSFQCRNLQHEKEKLLKEEEQQREERDKLAEELRIMQEEITLLSAQLHSEEESIEKSEKENLQSLDEISRLSHRIASLKQQQEYAEKRKEYLRKEEEEVKKAQQAEAGKEEEKKAERNTLQAKLSEKQEEHNTLSGELTSLQEGYDRQEKELHQQQGELREIKGKKETIAHILAGAEDLSGGSRALLKAFPRQFQEGVFSFLIDHLQTETEEDGKMLELLLKEKMDALVIQKKEHLPPLLAYIEEQKINCTLFLPFLKTDRKETDLPVTPETAEYIPLGKTLKAAGITSSLLRNAYKATNPLSPVLTDNTPLPEGVSILNDKAFLCGQFLTFSGKAEQAQSPLQRRNLFKQLEKEEKEYEASVTLLTQKLERKREERKTLKEQKEKTQQTLQSLHSEQSRITERLESLKQETLRLKKQQETIRTEKQNLQRETEQTQNALKELEETLLLLNKKKDSRSDNLLKQKRALKEKRSQLAEKESILNSHMMEYSTLDGIIERSALQRRKAEEQQAEKQREKEKLIQAITESEEAKENLIREEERLQQEIHTFNEEWERLFREKQKKAENLDTLRASHAKLLEKEQEHNRNLRESARKTEEASARLAEAHAAVLHLEDDILQKTSTTPEELRLKKHEKKRNIAEIQKERFRQEEKLKALGDINYTAIQEFQEAEERLSFLLSQKEDLEKATASIEETIAKIDRSTRKMFRETFEQVNSNFRKIFSQLFEGGEAFLELEKPENILETGILIFVRPPGKKLQALTLLSSGEKAMTTTALIFAVFMVRPSPFCFLDEVDAPLDDINIQRFVKLLKQFTDHTQFVVISHNQKTMSFADILYGVTMEERGVSKVVSVKMTDKKEETA